MVYGPTLEIDPTNSRKCNHCSFISKADNVKSSLHSHHKQRLLIESGGERYRSRSQCPCCRREARSDNMYSHVERAHSGRHENFPCLKCKNAGFARRKEFEEHEQYFCPYLYGTGELDEDWKLNEQGIPVRKLVEHVTTHGRPTAPRHQSSAPSSAHQPFTPIIRSRPASPVYHHDATPAGLHQHQIFDPNFSAPHIVATHGESNYSTVPFDPVNQWHSLDDLQYPHNNFTDYTNLYDVHPYQGGNGGYLDPSFNNNFQLPLSAHQQDPFGDFPPPSQQNSAYVNPRDLFNTDPSSQNQHRHQSLAKRLSPRQLRRYGRYLVD